MLPLRKDRRGSGVVQTRPERVLSEGGVQGLHDPTHLQDREEGDVELRDAIHEQADGFPRLETQPAQVSGDSVRVEPKVVKRVRPLIPLVALPDQRGLLPQPQVAEAIAAVPADVDGATFDVPQLLF